MNQDLIKEHNMKYQKINLGHEKDGHQTIVFEWEITKVFAKLLSFMIDKADRIRLVKVYTYRTKPHTTKRAPMNYKSVI